MGCTKSKDQILLADLVCFEVQHLPRSAHLKIFIIFAFLWRFKYAYPFLTTTTKMFYISFFLSVFFFASFFFYYYLFFLHLTKTIFCRKRFVSLLPCVMSYRWIHFPSSVLSVLSTSSVVVHSFLGMCFFFFSYSGITRVIVLYTSLRFQTLSIYFLIFCAVPYENVRNFTQTVQI